jgi:hypothetical protein
VDGEADAGIINQPAAFPAITTDLIVSLNEKAGETMILRISLPGADEHGGPRPDPVYGDQIQGRAIAGVPPEADVFVEYTETAGTFADGEPFSLRRPAYRIANPGYGPIAADLLTSPRVAPSVIRLGLLEAVPAAALEGMDDPDDAGSSIRASISEARLVRRGSCRGEGVREVQSRGISQSVTSPPRIVCARSSQSRSTHVRADIRVAPRLPPGEPGVSVCPPTTDVEDGIRKPQREDEHDREHDGGRDVHCSAPPGATDLQMQAAVPAAHSMNGRPNC